MMMELNHTVDAVVGGPKAAVVSYFIAAVLMACGGLVGTWTNFALFRSVRCSRLFHANVRLLLLHSIAACGIVCFHQIIQGIASSMTVANQVLSMRITKKECILLQTPSMASFLVCSLCIAALGTERLLATLKNHYEDNEHSSAAVKAFVSIAWAGGIFSALIFLLLPNQEAVVHYCSIFLLNISPLLYITCGFYCMIATITVAVYWETYKLNSTRVLAFSINTATHSLQERFQLRNNVSITFALLPCVLCNSITFVLVFGTLTIMAAIFVREERMDLWLVNCYLLVVNLLCLSLATQPIMLLNRCRKLRLLKFDWRSVLFPCVRSEDPEQHASASKTSIVQFHVNPDSQEALLQTFWSSKSRMHRHRNSSSGNLFCGLFHFDDHRFVSSTSRPRSGSTA